MLRRATTTVNGRPSPGRIGTLWSLCVTCGVLIVTSATALSTPPLPDGRKSERTGDGEWRKARLEHTKAVAAWTTLRKSAQARAENGRDSQRLLDRCERQLVRLAAFLRRGRLPGIALPSGLKEYDGASRLAVPEGPGGASQAVLVDLKTTAELLSKATRLETLKENSVHDRALLLEITAFVQTLIAEVKQAEADRWFVQALEWSESQKADPARAATRVRLLYKLRRFSEAAAVAATLENDLARLEGDALIAHLQVEQGIARYAGDGAAVAQLSKRIVAAGGAAEESSLPLPSVWPDFPGSPRDLGAVGRAMVTVLDYTLTRHEKNLARFLAAVASAQLAGSPRLVRGVRGRTRGIGLAVGAGGGGRRGLVLVGGGSFGCGCRQ